MDGAPRPPTHVKWTAATERLGEAGLDEQPWTMSRSRLWQPVQIDGNARGCAGLGGGGGPEGGGGCKAPDPDQRLGANLIGDLRPPQSDLPPRRLIRMVASDKDGPIRSQGA